VTDLSIRGGDGSINITVNCSGLVQLTSHVEMSDRGPRELCFNLG
jgi:hypothetical protein